MKIAHIAPAFYPAHVYGGPSYSAYRLCGALADLGHEVRVLTTDANGLRETLDVDTEAEVSLAPRFTARYCRRLVRHSVSLDFIRHLGAFVAAADVVHLTAVYNFTTLPTLLACKVRRKPLVWSPRGGLQRWAGSTNVRLKDVWDWACRALAPDRMVLHVTSEDEAQQSLRRYSGVSAANIPNGIDLPEVRAREPAPALRLLYIGRLHPIKGLENLIQAAGLLKGAPFSWRLTIAGDGGADYRATLHALVGTLGIGDRVTFCGDVRDDAKDSLFRSSDVLVLPSHSENFGIAAAEALAYGIPVIASKGTPWSRLESEGCGAWVSNEPGALARAIAQMASSPREDYGMRARALAESEFSWGHVAGQMAMVYEGLLEKPAGRAGFFHANRSR